MLKANLNKELSNEDRLMIVSSSAIEEAKAMSDRYLEKALRELSFLPKGKAVKTMRKIAYFIGKRNF